MLFERETLPQQVGLPRLAAQRLAGVDFAMQVALDAGEQLREGPSLGGRRDPEGPSVDRELDLRHLCKAELFGDSVWGGAPPGCCPNAGLSFSCLAPPRSYRDYA